jgi:hypothetical protein
MRLHVLHPGTITSLIDGRAYFINARKLAWLYGVEFDDCIVISDDRDAGTKLHGIGLGDITHLWPQVRSELYPRLNQAAGGRGESF